MIFLSRGTVDFAPGTNSGKNRQSPDIIFLNYFKNNANRINTDIYFLCFPLNSLSMKFRMPVVAAFALFAPATNAQPIVSVTDAFIALPAPFDTGGKGGIDKTTASGVFTGRSTAQGVFADFTAAENQNSITLSWQVPDKTAFEGYAVEKSTNGIDFFIIAQQKNKSNTEADNSYTYTDRLTGHPQVLYYRIRTLERDGSSRFSKTITVRLISHAADVIVYPNPVRNTLYLNITVDAPEQATVTAWNASGAQVISQQFHLVKGSNILTVNGFEELPPGIYQIHVKLPEKVFAKPVLKQ